MNARVGKDVRQGGHVASTGSVMCCAARPCDGMRRSKERCCMRNGLDTAGRRRGWEGNDGLALSLAPPSTHPRSLLPCTSLTYLPPIYNLREGPMPSERHNCRDAPRYSCTHHILPFLSLSLSLSRTRTPSHAGGNHWHAQLFWFNTPMHAYPKLAAAATSIKNHHHQTDPWKHYVDVHHFLFR